MRINDRNIYLTAVGNTVADLVLNRAVKYTRELKALDHQCPVSVISRQVASGLQPVSVDIDITAVLNNVIGFILCNRGPLTGEMEPQLSEIYKLRHKNFTIK